MAKVVTTNANFTFPVGNQGFLGEIGISPVNPTNTSATSVPQTTFTAQYFRQSATSISNAVETPLHHVSALEYWMLDRTNGTSNGRVTLHWTGYSDVSATPAFWKELRVARYDAPLAIWQNRGPGEKLNTNTTFDPAALGATYNKGYVTSDEVSAFSPFTLASTIPNNPLPVELVSLQATPQGESVRVSWVTASEKNTDYFEVQHSRDGQSFTTLARQQAQGESSSAHRYHYPHQQASQMNYYRLRIVDQDGSSRFSSVVTAQLTGAATPAVELYPNPSNGREVYLKTAHQGLLSVRITSLVGVVHHQLTLQAQPHQPLALPVSLPAGTYLVSVRCGQSLAQLKLIVKP